MEVLLELAMHTYLFKCAKEIKKQEVFLTFLDLFHKDWFTSKYNRKIKQQLKRQGLSRFAHYILTLCFNVKVLYPKEQATI